MGLVAAVLDSADIKHFYHCRKFYWVMLFQRVLKMLKTFTHAHTCTELLCDMNLRNPEINIYKELSLKGSFSKELSLL